MRMPRDLVVGVLVGVLFGAVAAAPAAAQVVSVVETPLRAYGADPEKRQATPPTAFTSYYVNILPALSGDANTDHIDTMPGFQFAAIRLVVSAGPSVFAGLSDFSGDRASSTLGALRHLNAHVTVRALDSAGQVIEPNAPGPLILATLEISPSEPTFATQGGNVSAGIGLATRQVESVIGPIGGLIQKFQSAFHRRPSASQVPYMTGPNAFGWRWYETADGPIEGLHASNALFQISSDIKSLRITVVVVADWRTFGVWAKTFEFTYALTKGS